MSKILLALSLIFSSVYENPVACHLFPSPILYRRFQDDILGVWRLTVQNIHQFYDYVNRKRPGKNEK